MVTSRPHGQTGRDAIAAVGGVAAHDAVHAGRLGVVHGVTHHVGVIAQIGAVEVDSGVIVRRGVVAVGHRHQRDSRCMAPPLVCRSALRYTAGAIAADDAGHVGGMVAVAAGVGIDEPGAKVIVPMVHAPFHDRRPHTGAVQSPGRPGGGVPIYHRVGAHGRPCPVVDIQVRHRPLFDPTHAFLLAQGHNPTLVHHHCPGVESHGPENDQTISLYHCHDLSLVDFREEHDGQRHCTIGPDVVRLKGPTNHVRVDPIFWPVLADPAHQCQQFRVIQVCRLIYGSQVIQAAQVRDQRHTLALQRLTVGRVDRSPQLHDGVQRFSGAAQCCGERFLDALRWRELPRLQRHEHILFPKVEQIEEQVTTGIGQITCRAAKAPQDETFVLDYDGEVGVVTGQRSHSHPIGQMFRQGDDDCAHAGRVQVGHVCRAGHRARAVPYRSRLCLIGYLSRLGRRLATVGIADVQIKLAQEGMSPRAQSDDRPQSIGDGRRHGTAAIPHLAGTSIGADQDEVVGREIRIGARPDNWRRGHMSSR